MRSGVENKLNLSDCLEEIKKEAVPRNLNQTLTSFRDNAFLKSTFGNDLHLHLWSFYNLEYTEFMNQVDDWELNRYLFHI